VRRNLGGDGYVGGRTILGDGDGDGIQLLSERDPPRQLATPEQYSIRSTAAMVDWWWSPTKSGDREEEDDADPDLRCPGIMYACVPGFCVCKICADLYSSPARSSLAGAGRSSLAGLLVCLA
jgi:hypothetical protein